MKKQTCTFGRLNQGDWFQADGFSFIKTIGVEDADDGTFYNATCLSPGPKAGDLMDFKNNDIVTYCYGFRPEDSP